MLHSDGKANMPYGDWKEIFVIKYLVKVGITGKRNDLASIKIQNKDFLENVLY